MAPTRVGCSDRVPLPSLRIGGSQPTSALSGRHLGRMPECRIATALRRGDPALVAARLVGLRCWGRHCRMRSAEALRTADSGVRTRT